MLLMKKRFFEAIRAGRKTATLRYWQRMQVRRGSVHVVPGLGRVKITDVRAVELHALDDADAAEDGFETAADLRDALQELYPPDRRDGRTLYKVRFELCDPR